MPTTTARDNRGYGYIPDLPDHRDRPLTLAPHVTEEPLPAEVHLQQTSPFQFPVYDQGDLGSCVGNATAAAIQFLFRKLKKPNNTPSRLAIYYGARKIEGTTTSDSGCMIRDAIKVVVKDGAGPESLWPYIIGQFKRMPPAAYFTAATKHRAVSYERVKQNASQIQRVLAAGYPVIVGISVYDSFESDDVATTGIVPMPAPEENLLGGHAVLICGYTDAGIEVRNSWGPKWGQKGYFTLPWAYILNPDLAEDFWVIKVES